MKQRYYIFLDTGKIQKELPEGGGFFTTIGYQRAREVAHLCRLEHWAEACTVACAGLKPVEETIEKSLGMR